MRAAHQAALVVVLQMVDGQRGHDRVERARGQWPGHVLDMHGADRVSEPCPRLAQHRLRAVQQLQPHAGERAGDLLTEQTGAGAEIEHPAIHAAVDQRRTSTTAP